MLARLFARPANVLVMDEPTNDLDVETLELLEELIADFPGTVLLVSHDRTFLDNIVTSTLAFEGEGAVTEYVGGWADYLRQSSLRRGGRGHADAMKNDATTRPSRDRGELPADSNADDRAVKRKLSYNERRELDTLPSRIEALEREQTALKSEMESADFYKAGPDRIKIVMARADAAARELEALISRWVDLEERS